MQYDKKLGLLIALLPALLFCLTSCSNDDESGGGSLKGTRWTVTHLGDKYVVEFTSETDVRSFDADVNNNYVNYMHEGKYTKSGDNITFEGNKLYFTYVIGLSGCDYYYFRSATVSGDIMKLTVEEVDLRITNLSTGDYTFTSKGTKQVTLKKI